MDLFSSGSVILLGVLGIGFVIFIHELGHFLFAKWAGVRVDTFSIGFGPIVWSRTIGETEYAVSLLPLGGYVAMREKPDGSGRSMGEVHPWWRAAILAAGVLFNLVSSFLVLLCLAFYGLPMIPPVVGDTAPTVLDQDRRYVDSPAARLGLRTGDRIVTLYGEEVRGFADLITTTIDHAPAPVTMTIERDGERLQLPRAGAEPAAPVYSPRMGRVTLGIDVPRSNRIERVAGIGAADLGLVPGARVVAIDGEDVADRIGQEIEERLITEIGRPVDLTLEMPDGARREVTVPFASRHPATLSDAGLGFPVSVRRLIPGMPAAQAGIRPGDVLVSVDGEPVSTDGHFRALIKRAAGTGDDFQLGLLRQDAAGTWQPQTVTLTTEVDAGSGRRLIGVEMDGHRTGAIPFLPPALGADHSPLAAAGIAVGDVILNVRADPDAADADTPQVLVDYLRAGELVEVSLPAAGEDALLRPYDPPLLSKFVGARPQPSIAERLLGTRVLTVGATAAHVLEVADPDADDDRPRAVDLGDVPEATRTALFQAVRPGDWIVDWHPRADGEGLVIGILRGNPRTEPRRAEVTPVDVGVAFAFGIDERPYRLAAWYEAFPLAADETSKIITVTFGIIPKFFRSAEAGGVDASKSLTGPIGIFSELKARAERGFTSFLKILAILGLNLVIVNLLPIPIADGGRLLLLGVEVITRRPVPERVENAINGVGFVLIVGLMLFVIGIDLLRNIGAH